MVGEKVGKEPGVHSVEADEQGGNRQIARFSATLCKVITWKCQTAKRGSRWKSATVRQNLCSEDWRDL